MQTSTPRSSHRLILTLALLSLLTLLAAPALAQDGALAECAVPAEYATIGAALTDPACAVINLDAGQYPENLVIARDVTIAGPEYGEWGTVINGGGLDRTILITNTATVTITDVTITNGVALTGALQAGGGILNYDGMLLLMSSVIMSNTARQGGGLANEKGDVTLHEVWVRVNTSTDSGGGVLNTATMTVENSYIEWNQALQHGGGVFNAGAMSMTATRFLRNRAAQNGGGVQNEGGALELADAYVASNQAASSAGIANINGALRITGGLIWGNTALAGAGGGVGNIALAAAATLWMTDCTVEGNHALRGLGGGGIVNQAGQAVTATVTLSNSRIVNNIATADPATPGAAGGGGILNSVMLTGAGGAAYLHLQGGVVLGNRAVNGAGIANATETNAAANLRADIRDSAILNNTTWPADSPLAGHGGGILNGNGDLRVINSTVSGNIAHGTPAGADDLSGLGGGIANAGSLHASTVQIINSTLTNNRAKVQGGGIATLLVNPAALGTRTELVNSIVANNTSTTVSTMHSNCVSLPPEAPNLYTSLGHNLENLDTCNFTQTSDKRLTDPLLLPLANNGGGTWTHALAAASPAINAGDNTVCQTQVGPSDQRGMPRLLGRACDLGAYEAYAWVVWTPLIQHP